MRKAIAVLSDVSDDTNFRVVTDDGLVFEWEQGKWWALGLRDYNYPEKPVPQDDNNKNNITKQ